MKRFYPFSCLLALLWLTLACGPDKDRVRFEGKLENINNAEFYVYSEDGSFDEVSALDNSGKTYSGRALLQHVLDGGERRDDARIVRDRARTVLRHRDVEIDAHENALAREIDIAQSLLSHFVDLSLLVKD